MTQYLILIMLTFSNVASSQFPDQTKRFRKEFIERENFGIRKKPITNREYLIFICWNIAVYGNSFPERVISLLPQENLETDRHRIKSYEELLRNSGLLLKDYILNPRYIDYPLTGLSQNQVMELQKWLSDRYNENILLRLGYLNFTPDQKDSDCFTLEAYLVGQYNGSTKNDKIIYWKENKFLATFRLPDQNELNILNLNLKDQHKVKKYKFKQNDFLEVWNNHYIKVDKSGISLLVRNVLDMRLPEGCDREIVNYIDQNDSEGKVINKENQFINRMYFDDADFEKKDKFGRMSFILIGENNSDRAIIANYQLDGDNFSLKNKIYRIAYNRVIDFEYWP